MKQKYRATRVPVEAYKNLKMKQENMNKVYFKMTGKKRNLPITKVIAIVAKEPVYLDDTKLVKFFGRKRLRRIK